MTPPAALVLECARSGERAFLYLEGSIEEAGASEMRRRAVQLIATGCNELSFDLERVTAIHQAGLEAFIRIEAMLPATKRALTITGPSRSVRAELEKAGLGEFIEGSVPFDYSSEMFGINLVSSSA